MSFILDALRKSEHQRQKNSTPGIADARVKPKQEPRSHWKLIVAVLLILNGALLLVLWLRSGDDPETTLQNSRATAAPQRTITPSATAPRSQSDQQTGQQTNENNRRLSGEVTNPGTARPATVRPAVTSGASPMAPPKTAPAQTTPPAETATRSALDDQTWQQVNAPADTPVAEVPSARSDAPTLPSLETLQLQGIITLPPQRIDLHVYSENPADRFVFVNMKKLREGEQLKDGPVIDEITPEGAILRYNGQRFVLSKD